MTFEEVSALLAVANAVYQDRFKVTQASIGIWVQMLGDLSAAEATAALHAHIATSPHPPTIADIRTRAATAAAALPGADEAWGEVMQQVQRRGRGRAWTFSHPAIAQTVERIGQDSICDCPVDNLSTLRAQFTRAYETCGKRTLHEANVGRLESHMAELIGHVAEKLKLPEGPKEPS